MSLRLSDHISKYKRRLPSAAEHAAATLATVVHGETPHDTFAAQNSWKLVIGGVDRTPLGGDFITASRTFKAGKDYSLLSSISYMRELEHGSSQQSPAGMIRVNAARWDDIVAFSVARVMNGN